MQVNLALVIIDSYEALTLEQREELMADIIFQNKRAAHLNELDKIVDWSVVEERCISFE